MQNEINDLRARVEALEAKLLSSHDTATLSRESALDKLSGELRGDLGQIITRLSALEGKRSVLGLK